MLIVKSPRPTKLSDPHCDFSLQSLRELLETPDSEMTWHHFRDLLGPYMPAGSYAESVYFLPKAFDYLIGHDKDALELITSLIWFASEYSQDLENDGILIATRERIYDCLTNLTEHFKVQHFDTDACRAKGWGIPYFDYIANCEPICEGTTDLVRFEAHSDLAVQFVANLANHQGDPIKAAWFLEYAKSKNDVYTPPDYEPINVMLSDKTLLEQAANVVRSHLVESEASPTYWNDTFTTLKLF